MLAYLACDNCSLLFLIPDGTDLYLVGNFFRRLKLSDLQVQMVTVKCLLKGERTQDTQSNIHEMRFNPNVFPP